MRKYRNDASNVDRSCSIWNEQTVIKVIMGYRASEEGHRLVPRS
jgi:hypothetical protein